MIALRILIVIALQTVALGYMIADRQAMLSSSRVVTLKVAPVDPRDIFRGDYVILSYGISNLDLTKLDGDDNLVGGEKVFVTVVQQGAEWNAVAIAKGKPFPVQGGVAIQGDVNYVDRTGENSTPTNARVTYGIESYFVPEGTGRAIEQERQQGDLTADIAVDAQGRPAIKALRRNGQVFYSEGVF